MSFDMLIRARLAALIERHGFALTSLGLAMGRSHTWLLRKLDLDRALLQPLDLAAVDAVLAHLGELPEVLFSPVLLPGDVDLLRYIAATDFPTVAGARTVFADAEIIVQRLVRQGLAADGEGLALTTLGHNLHAALPKIAA